MAVSVRARFEVFKRDGFTCRYCGRKSPEVVLEVDHIIPVAEGGSDDEMNLATSCWDCNRGKSAVPLTALMTGSDPHDRAIELLERERQLREYEEVLQQIEERVQIDLEVVLGRVRRLTGRKGMSIADVNWLRSVLRDKYSVYEVLDAVDIACERNKLRDFRYVAGILKNTSLRQDD